MSDDSTPKKATVGTAEDGPELVRFDRVSKRFGAHTVLDSLDMTVYSGKHVTLIGPSGSGKTTILRLLMTLLKPDEARSRSGTPI